MIVYVRYASWLEIFPGECSCTFNVGIIFPFSLATLSRLLRFLFSYLEMKADIGIVAFHTNFREFLYFHILKKTDFSVVQDFWRSVYFKISVCIKPEAHGPQWLNWVNSHKSLVQHIRLLVLMAKKKKKKKNEDFFTLFFYLMEDYSTNIKNTWNETAIKASFHFSPLQIYGNFKLLYQPKNINNGNVLVEANSSVKLLSKYLQWDSNKYQFSICPL